MKRLLTLIAVFVLWTGYAPAQTTNDFISFEWIAPIEYEDGTPLFDLAGFKLYYGNFPGGPYLNWIDIPDTGLRMYTIEPLADGEWYFVMTAYNSLGIESVFSNEDAISVRGPDPRPKAVTGFRVVRNWM